MPPAWRHVLLVVCVCVCICVCAGLSSAASSALDGGQIKGDSDPLATFNHAVALQQQGQLEAAVVAWRNFLIQQPRNLAGLSNLAVVLARLGRFEEAIEEYERALKVEPKNATVRLNLGIARYKAAQFREAAKELARVRALQPGNLQATLLEADCQSAHGRRAGGDRVARADREEAATGEAGGGEQAASRRRRERPRDRLHARHGVSARGEGRISGRCGSIASCATASRLKRTC